MQDQCIFSSKHAADAFKEAGCENVHNVPIGFDEDFSSNEEKYLEGKVHFGLMGKFENRKNTSQIIKNWAKKYGNNYKYQLSCCINNPFFKPENLNSLISSALNGQVYGNINFQYVSSMPMTDSNSLFSDSYNLTNMKFGYLININKKLNFKVYMGINNIFDEAYASQILINASGFGGNAPRYYYPGNPVNYYSGLNLNYRF